MTTMGTVAYAAANGMLPVTPTCPYTTLPMNCSPENRVGVM